MRKHLVGVVALAIVAVYGATSVGQSKPHGIASTRTIANERAGGDLGSERLVPAVVHRSQAAWYKGSTSAGTRIDFRLSSSGLWVRDFHFGSPPIICAPGSGPAGSVPDGNFPLIGLRVSKGTFRGQLHPEDDTPQTPDQPFAEVSGRFIDQPHVTGTLAGGSRSCGSYVPLSFTATRVRSLPARPVRGGGYAGQILRRTASKTAPPFNVRFMVSRSGRRVTAFRIARIYTYCKENDTSFVFTLAHSYPAAGLGQNRDGVFSGVLSSRVTAGGRPAGTRVLVSVLFLSSREASGTVRLLAGGMPTRPGGTCTAHETLTWRAALTHEIRRKPTNQQPHGAASQ